MSDEKCGECGAPIPTDPYRGMHCSKACEKAFWDRGIADGSIRSFSDMTLEQANEELKTIGLALEGVGPRKPS